MIKNKDLFQIKNEIFEYQFYEKEFFENIPIIGDGNCLYRTISYYFNNNQYQYSQLRQTTYNYVKSNITKFYEYCYVENNIYYIDIEEDNNIHKYILDDHVENIKKNGFFAGFIEINALSIILNRPIMIYEEINYDNNISYYSKISKFYNGYNDIYNIKDIIFINFIN